MAFTSTTGRYASFGTVSTIPGEVIDSFWFIIDNYLKGVFPLDPVLNFELLNRSGKLSIRFSQDGKPTRLVLDTQIDVDPNWQSLYHAVDNMGRETIMTAREI